MEVFRSYRDAKNRQVFIMSTAEFVNFHISKTTGSCTDQIKIMEVFYHLCFPPPHNVLRLTQGSYGLTEFVRDRELLTETQVTSPIPKSIRDITTHLTHLNYCERRVFATSQGFIGLGPEYVQEGDLVVILPGGKVPFLLASLRLYEGQEFAQRQGKQTSSKKLDEELETYYY